MVLDFITIRWLDFFDILLFALLLYQFYMMTRGSIAINIFIGIIFIYLFWLLVQALNMKLLSTFLGQVMEVGMIAIIIVFQQEIRRFLLLIGSRYVKNRFSIRAIFTSKEKTDDAVNAKAIVDACSCLSQTSTGALIVIGRISALDIYAETGIVLNSAITPQLIETVFTKNSPLHDGAMIVLSNRIYSVRCILPVSQSLDLPHEMGMRHRAALGITEQNDSFVIVVSEATGNISYCEYGKITMNVSPEDLLKKLESEFPTNH